MVVARVVVLLAVAAAAAAVAAATAVPRVRRDLDDASLPAWLASHRVALLLLCPSWSGMCGEWTGAVLGAASGTRLRHNNPADVGYAIVDPAAVPLWLDSTGTARSWGTPNLRAVVRRDADTGAGSGTGVIRYRGSVSAYAVQQWVLHVDAAATVAAITELDAALAWMPRREWAVFASFTDAADPADVKQFHDLPDLLPPFAAYARVTPAVMAQLLHQLHPDADVSTSAAPATRYLAVRRRAGDAAVAATHVWRKPGRSVMAWIRRAVRPVLPVLDAVPFADTAQPGSPCAVLFLADPSSRAASDLLTLLRDEIASQLDSQQLTFLAAGLARYRTLADRFAVPTAISNAFLAAMSSTGRVHHLPGQNLTDINSVVLFLESVVFGGEDAGPEVHLPPRLTLQSALVPGAAHLRAASAPELTALQSFRAVLVLVHRSDVCAVCQVALHALDDVAAALDEVPDVAVRALDLVRATLPPTWPAVRWVPTLVLQTPSSVHVISDDPALRLSSVSILAWLQQHGIAAAVPVDGHTPAAAHPLSEYIHSFPREGIISSAMDAEVRDALRAEADLVQ